MRTITITSNNISSSLNSSFIYKFPNSCNFKGASIALQSSSLYYSWSNISSAKSNNKFTYYMPCASTSPTYTGPDGVTYSPVNIPAGTYSASQPIGKGYKRVITIPDGIYSFSDLNAFLQYTFIYYGDYYFSSSTSTNTYFITLEVNASRYSAQINTFQVSTPPSGSVLTLTGTNLSTGWVKPTLPTNMVIQFNNPGLGSLFGYPLFK